ncbi:MAG: secondary thiamine-phosphate synthase enzyme YjbQ [Planctomycetota bacterium]|nr:secondary thiamine-phosphate synthase enzyme YjbQ [Planctomycetota bacterium]
MIQHSELTFETPGRGTTDVTDAAQAEVRKSGTLSGTALFFIQHTSASLIVCENADPQVRRDLEAWLIRAVPDGDPLFRHTAEGPDDMPAHVRSTLTATSLTVPIVDGRLHLGTWQGIFLYEHRTHPHRRRIHLTITNT